MRDASQPQENLEALKVSLLDAFKAQGFVVGEANLQLVSTDKEALRAVHAQAVEHNIGRARRGLARHETRLLGHIAGGTDVDPLRIRPRLVEVQPDSEQELLFRYARLHWSIPVSAGYGRRLRFAVHDEDNDKLIGIMGFADPVFNLGARDKWIGWTKEMQRSRLANVMDIFVLGAVPPYSSLLFGKLIRAARLT